MNAEIQPIYQVPPIMFILCLLSGIAIVVAILRWVWLMRENKSDQVNLKAVILQGQISIILFITMLSLCLTIYDYCFSDIDMTQATIIPESIILLGSGYYYAKHYKREGIPVVKGLFSLLRNIIYWVLACLLGWCMTGVAGVCIYYIIVFLSRNTSDYMMFTFMVTGGMWVAVTIGFHTVMTKLHPEAYKLAAYPPLRFLMPLAVAFFILLVPFGLTEAARSPELQQKMNQVFIQKI